VWGIGGMLLTGQQTDVREEKNCLIFISSTTSHMNSPASNPVFRGERLTINHLKYDTTWREFEATVILELISFLTVNTEFKKQSKKD
jgi:hypothetical protein